MINKLISSAGFLAGGGEIEGDLTIDGDLLVKGDGALSLDLAVTGDDITFSSSTSNKPALTLWNSNNDDSPSFLNFVKDNTGSAADGDEVGQLQFKAYNDAGTPELTIYADMYASTDDVSNGTEDGSISARVMRAGTLTTALVIDANSRISLSNNDNANTGNTIFGASAFNCGSNNASDYNVVIGQTAMGTGTVSAASHNVAIGADAITDSTSATDNVAIGSSSMYNATSAVSNVAIGRQSMGLGVVTGNENVAIGKASMYDAIGASGNTSVGTESLYNLTSGNNNVSIGKVTLNGSGVNPSNSTAVGYGASRYAQGDGNTSLGNAALSGVSGFIGTYNIAIGFESADTFELGEEYNISIGASAMGAMQEGEAGGDIDYNIAIGRDALKGGDLDTNDRQVQSNIAIGHYALDGTGANAQTGTIAIGASSLSALTTGGSNTIIGHHTGQHLTTGQNNTVLGYQAFSDLDVGGSDNARTSSDNVFIGKNAGGGVWTDAASNQNTVVGTLAMDGNMAGALANTAIGWSAGTAINSGDNNTLIGDRAGDSVTSGSTNTCVGSTSDCAATNNNQIAIGSGAVASGSNVGIWGNASIGTNNITVDWTVTSDQRVKKDIKNSDIGLSFINDLKPRKFRKKHPSEWDDEILEKRYKKGGINYDDDKGEVIKDEFDDKTVFNGLIAQEVKESMDKLGVEFSGWYEAPNSKQGIQYSTLVMPLIKAIQELSKKVEKLENK